MTKPLPAHFAGQNGAAVAGAPPEPPFTVLPIDMRGRRYIVGEECGETFARDEEFDGLTLTVEMKSEAEARAVLQALMWQAKED